MMFADTTGQARMACKRHRRRRIERDRGEKLAIRDMAMKVLRDKHGFMIHDLSDAFGISRWQVRRSLASIDEAVRRSAS